MSRFFIDRPVFAWVLGLVLMLAGAIEILQLPESVSPPVEADKGDDGVIQHNLVGAKSFGFLDPEYTIGVLDGAVTRW